jgi:hypothetical protein
MAINMKLLFPLCVLLLIPAVSMADDKCIEVSLWGKPHTYGPDSKLDPHPCGGTKIVCLNTITETEELEPGWAYEIGKNKVIARWPIPVDGQVYSVEGSKIIVAFPNDKESVSGNAWEAPTFILINSNGNLKKSTPIKEQYVKAFSCPELKDVPGIKDMWCYSFQGKGKNEERVIAVPSVCS